MPNDLDIAISVTCYKRLDYLSTMFRALDKSLSLANKNNTPIYISVDYYHSSIVKYVNSLNQFNKIIVVNNPSLGCNKNTKQAIELAISNHDAVIHLEDDTIPTRDAINFYTENLNKYKDESSILSISGYNKTTILEPERYKEIIKESSFICWGCAFWKNKSDIIINNWTQFQDRENRYGSWDTHLHNNIFQKLGYYQARPIISRIQNIGAKNGTYSSLVANQYNMDETEWHTMNHMSPYTSDDLQNAKNNQ